LFILFLPVIISSPMLLIGVPEKRLKGDRWGALWWYELLVGKMESAGPTFIKVCTLVRSVGV
jgi:aarF domain-containing kinase